MGMDLILLLSSGGDPDHYFIVQKQRRVIQKKLQFNDFFSGRRVKLHDSFLKIINIHVPLIFDVFFSKNTKSSIVTIIPFPVDFEVFICRLIDK